MREPLRALKILGWNQPRRGRKAGTPPFNWVASLMVWLVVRGDFDDYWIERNNASTAMLDKEMVGAVIRLPPPKDNADKPSQILHSSCILTINGSIRRNFSVPKSAKAVNIFCPVKTD